MAKQSKANNAKIARERKALEDILVSMPDNPIPWGVMLKLAAPIVARLAVRYALKRVARSLSEEKVNAVGEDVADFIADILERRVPK